MWRACPAMPGMFLGPDGQAGCGRHRLACHLPFPSTRRPPATNPRSTVGTVTEIYDYLRLLCTPGWACPTARVCGRDISQQTVDQIVDAGRWQAAGGDEVSGPGPGRPRAQGRPSRKSLEAARRSWLCPRADRRQPVRSCRGDHAGKEQQAHRGGGGGPAGHARGHPRPSGRLAGDRHLPSPAAWSSRWTCSGGGDA